MRGQRGHSGRWIAVAAVLVGVMVLVLLVTGLRNSRHGLAARFDSRGHLASDFAAEYVQQVATRERRLAARHLAGDLTPARFDDLVQGNDFVAAVLLDKSGDLLQVHPQSDEVPRSGFAARYPHLQRAVEGKPAVSDVVPSAAKAEPIVAVAIPFTARGGDRRVFSSGFRISRTPLDAFVRKSVPIAGSSAYLVDGAGTVIASSNDALVGKRLTDEVPSLRQAAAEGSGELTWSDESAHYVSTAVDGTSWRMLLTVSHAALYRPLRSAMWLQTAALVVLFALVGVVGLLIRQLVRAERTLEAKVGELELANRTLDTFSHTLVHDLRNPLTVIRGFAQTLGEVLTDADAQARVMTERIESSAVRMRALIEDVLALATVTRTVTRTACDPRALLTEVAADMPNVQVTIGWMPETISADRSSLYRCFQNLLENASAHALEADGTARVDVAADETPWHWRFTFQDHGPGISPEEQQRVFTAFERGMGTTVGTGTGLGLSIVAACAQAHGGTATVENVPGGGALFTVDLGKPPDAEMSVARGQDSTTAASYSG